MSLCGLAPLCLKLFVALNKKKNITLVCRLQPIILLTSLTPSFLSSSRPLGLPSLKALPSPSHSHSIQHQLSLTSHFSLIATALFSFSLTFTFQFPLIYSPLPRPLLCCSRPNHHRHSLVPLNASLSFTVDSPPQTFGSQPRRSSSSKSKTLWP